MTVLVVEDDNIIREGLQISLRQDGYDVLTAATQNAALDTISGNQTIDAFLLDVMLPDGDGYTICREIRKKSDAPILFLTACDDEVHTVLALEQGADDYIAKPFRIRELLARMKAILRRVGKDVVQQSRIAIGDNELDLQAGKVYRNQKNIELTAMEYRLLLIFVNHRGQTLSRKQLLTDIWDEAGDFVNDNTLTVYIKRLREKLGDFEGQPLIQTVRGIGYRMEKQRLL
ncbi:MAG: response regulator transcription factor [Oliverpabstia sp.]|nr:response regulator transcription factor [Eubacterium sp.]